jgi:hypothetical protein
MAPSPNLTLFLPIFGSIMLFLIIALVIKKLYNRRIYFVQTLRYRNRTMFRKQDSWGLIDDEELNVLKPQPVILQKERDLYESQQEVGGRGNVS